MLMRVATTIVSLLFAAASFAQPAPQNEFIPMDKLPPADQLPSAPLLVGAYAFVWIAAMFYLWTIWRRLNRVETEMRLLEQKSAAGRR